MFLADLKYQGEELLEPVFRRFRFDAARSYCLGRKRLLDFGCGPSGRLYHYLKKRRITFKEYVGYDPLVPSRLRRNDSLLTSDLHDIRGKFDLITMFAVLEHLRFPDFDFSLFSRITGPGSLLVLTTPHSISRHLLETLSHRIGLVSPREIAEHQHYYSREEIIPLFEKFGFRLVEFRYFEFGFNILSVFVRI